VNSHPEHLLELKLRIRLLMKLTPEITTTIGFDTYFIYLLKQQYYDKTYNCIMSVLIGQFYASYKLMQISLLLLLRQDLWILISWKDFWTTTANNWYWINMTSFFLSDNKIKIRLIRYFHIKLWLSFCESIFCVSVLIWNNLCSETF